MNFKHLFTFTFLFLSGVNHALAVSPGEYSISKNSTYVFRYDFTAEPSINNFFIKEIARLNFLNLQRTEYTLEYDLMLDIDLSADMNLKVLSRLELKGLSGNTFYKDFDLSDVMLPGCYAYKFLISGDNRIIDSILVTELEVGHERVLETKLTLGQPPPANLRIEVSDVKFIYRNEDKYAFQKRVSDINDYLALSELSVFQLEKAELIDAENPSELLSTYFEILDLERYLWILHNDLQAVSFNVPEERNEFLMVKLKQLNSNHRRLNTLFKLTSSAQHPMLTQADLSKACQTITSMQLDYLDELNRQDFSYEPVYREMAAFFVEDSSLASISANLDRNFKLSMAKSGSVTLSGNDFFDALVKDYLNRSDSLLNNEKYHLAEVLLESAGEVCIFIDDEKSGLKVYNQLSTTKWGIYDAYLRVAHSAMETGNLDMSKKYLETASAYQKENNTFIATNGFAVDEFEKLAWAYFEQGNNEYKSEFFRKAELSYSQALDLYRTLGIMKYDDVLLKKINNARQRIIGSAD